MRTFFACCLTVITAISFSQDLQNHVPALSSVVFVVNTQSIHEKCDVAGLQAYEFFTELKENSEEYLGGARVEEALVPMLVANAKDFGLSTVDNSYAFTRKRDSINYTAYIARITNEEALNGLVKTMILREGEINHGIGEGFEFAFNDRSIIAWNSRMVAFLDYYIPYSSMWYNDYEVVEELNEEYYESYEERYEAEEKKKKERKMENILRALEELYNPNPDHTISGNEHFQKATKGDFDLCLFMDGLSGMTSNMSAMSLLLGSRGDMDKMLSMFADNYSYFHLNINEHDLQAKTFYHVGDRFRSQMTDANKGKFNKDLFKYIDGSNLVGYFGVAIEPEPSYEMFMDVYSGIMSAVPEYGEAFAAGLDIFSILLDEDEVFDMIKGDAFFAVTDIKEFDVSYTTYEYDEEFNEQEVTKTKKEMLPEYVFVSSIGNPNLRDKIVKIYEKSEMLIPTGEGYYRYESFLSRYNSIMGTAEEEAATYIAIENDVLIVTNNKDLVTQYRVSGLPKDRQLSKDRMKHIKKNNYAGYWSADATFSKLDKEISRNFGDEFFEMVNEASKVFNNAILNGVDVEGNLFTSTLTLNVKDQEKLMISQLLEFVEHMYQLEK